tara:strand:+ start:7775 stop:8104 length:330 start_codon:yes stop_codon:yes gene_type:complete
MTIAITTLLVMICVLIVGLPFWTRSNYGKKIVDPLEEIEEISRRSRERIYEEIRVLQQEYFLNSISQEEYILQLNSAREKAAALLVSQQEAKRVIDNVYTKIEQSFNDA